MTFNLQKFSLKRLLFYRFYVYIIFIFSLLFNNNANSKRLMSFKVAMLNNTFFKICIGTIEENKVL